LAIFQGFLFAENLFQRNFHFSGFAIFPLKIFFCIFSKKQDLQRSTTFLGFEHIFENFMIDFFSKFFV